MKLFCETVLGPGKTLVSREKPGQVQRERAVPQYISS